MGAQRSEAAAQAPQLARAEATTQVQPCGAGPWLLTTPRARPRGSPFVDGGCVQSAHRLKLQNNRSRGLLREFDTVLLWPGRLSPIDARTSASGAMPHVRAHVCLCVCICAGERHRAGQVNQLGAEQIRRLLFFNHCLLSWAQGLSGASLFSQGINKGTFSSVIMIKIIIINTAVAYISPASLSPDLKTLGK